MVKAQTKNSVIDLAVTRSIAKTQGMSSAYQEKVNDSLQYYRVSEKGLTRTIDQNGLDNAIQLDAMHLDEKQKLLEIIKQQGAKIRELEQ